MRAELPQLTERFLAAVALAQEVHGGQRRSGTEIPYLAHLLVVTGLVLEDGGDEDQAIAAMLHDAVEDGGGSPLLERIRHSFGGRVASIVAGCSDSVDVDPAESWIARKQRYLDHLREVQDDAILRVALADKVHNARSLVRDYREEGDALWERFTQKTAREQLWYYGGLLAFLRARRAGPLTEDLDRAVGELAWLIAREHAQGHEQLWLWVDPDLHERQAPNGWAQVRTASEAIRLLDEFSVGILSCAGPAEATPVIRWLTEQEVEGRDRWPTQRIEIHDLEALPSASLALCASQNQQGASAQGHGRRAIDGTSRGAWIEGVNLDSPAEVP
jgi:HD domain